VTFADSQGKAVTDEVHPKLVRRIKPFCEVPEKETALYAYVKGIKFQNTPCPYASEALRNDARMIVDMLEEKHPGITFTIFNSIERIRPALEELAKEEGLASALSAESLRLTQYAERVKCGDS